MLSWQSTRRWPPALDQPVEPHTAIWRVPSEAVQALEAVVAGRAACRGPEGRAGAKHARALRRGPRTAGLRRAAGCRCPSLRLSSETAPAALIMLCSGGLALQNLICAHRPDRQRPVLLQALRSDSQRRRQPCLPSTRIRATRVPCTILSVSSTSWVICDRCGDGPGAREHEDLVLVTTEAPNCLCVYTCMEGAYCNLLFCE